MYEKKTSALFWYINLKQSSRENVLVRSLPISVNVPDTLIKVLSSPRNEIYAKVLPTDVKYTRNVVKSSTEFYLVINNQEKEIAAPILSLMETEEIKIIPFSEREKFITELSA